ncbi:MAG TPA: hypothetical protein VGC09_13950, partial [Rhodopila sp.]
GLRPSFLLATILDAVGACCGLWRSFRPVAIAAAGRRAPQRDDNRPQSGTSSVDADWHLKQAALTLIRMGAGMPRRLRAKAMRFQPAGRSRGANNSAGWQGTVIADLYQIPVKLTGMRAGLARRLRANLTRYRQTDRAEKPPCSRLI